MHSLVDSIKPFSVVVAISKNNGIGNKGSLPWPYLSKDMKHFSHITSSNEGMSLSLSDIAAKECFF